MTPEAAFFKAWGREPSRAERERIRRLQTAFAIDENDALLTIAMVLEFYDGIFRLYPGKCADAVKQAMKESGLHAAAAHVPTSASSSLPSPAPSPPPHPSAPSDPRAHDWVTLGGLTATFMILFGAGIAIGAALGQRHGELAALASPAACIVAPLPLVYVGTWGWGRIAGATRSSKERRLGWVAVTAAGMAAFAWLLLLRAATSGV